MRRLMVYTATVFVGLRIAGLGLELSEIRGPMASTRLWPGI